MPTPGLVSAQPSAIERHRRCAINPSSISQDDVGVAERPRAYAAYILGVIALVIVGFWL